ncbi:T9SS type A sorting domain-containing protein [bacterium]|nr:T9SS type A sorting domain-containing protein [bacterium]
MKNSTGTSTTCFIIFLVLGILSFKPCALQADEPYEILFIGSSYFNYNNLPDIFDSLAVNANKDLFIDEIIPNGLYLADHAASAVTEAKINERDWDFVILQGVGRITAYPDYYVDHPVLQALSILQTKIYSNCESSGMIFCMPWAFEDGMTWMEGWNDTFADMQTHIYDNTLLYSEELGFMISPVGWSWLVVLEEENYPLHYLHQSDWNHPSRKGSYLMACTIFTSVYRESSDDIPYYYTIGEATANNFQEVASNMVLDSLDLWNIPAVNLKGTNPVTPDQLRLNQNFPNPFNPSTRISYHLPQNANVSLSIFDALGREIASLVSETQKSGSYQASWNGINQSGLTVSSGVYIARLQVGSDASAIKMIYLQ